MISAQENNKASFVYKAIMLLLLLIFPPLAHGAVEIWSVSLVHIIVIVLATTILIEMTLKGHFKLHFTAIDLFICIFLILAGFSVHYSVYPYASRMALFKIIGYVIIFYLMIHTVRTRKQLHTFLWILLLFGSLFATTALIKPEGKFFGFDIFSSGNDSISLTFVNRNHFAGYLEMMVWLCIGFALVNKGAKQIIFLILAVYMAIAIFFSLSRGGILGFLSSVVFAMLVSAFCYDKKKHLLLLGSLLLLILVGLSWLGLEPVISKIETLKEPSIAAGGRLEYWKGTLRMIAAKPWFGTGLRTFEYVFPRYQTSGLARLYIDYAHNDYLQLAAETGIAGLFTCIGLIGFLFTKCLKRIIRQKDAYFQIIGATALTATFSILIHSIFDFNLHIPSNAIFFVICIGILHISTHQEDHFRKKSQVVHLPKIMKPILILLILIVSATSCRLVAAPYLGHKLYKAACSLQQDQAYDRALNCLEKATMIDPGNIEYFVRAGDIFYTRAQKEIDSHKKKGHLNSALKHYNEALEACPVNSYHYTKQAFTLQQLQQTKQAEQAFEKAVYYHPNAAYTNFNLACFYQSVEKYDLAIKSYIKSLEINHKYLGAVLGQLEKAGKEYEYIRKVLPEDAGLRQQYAQHLFKKGHYKEALQEFKQAYKLAPAAIYARAHVRAYYRMADYGTALDLCMQYLDQYPQDLPLQKQLADIYLKQKNYEAAKEQYEALLLQYPENALLHMAMADYFTTIQKPEEALEHLKQAVFLKPEDPNYRYRLEEAYKQYGLYLEAAEQWGNMLRDCS